VTHITASKIYNSPKTERTCTHHIEGGLLNSIRLAISSLLCERVQRLNNRCPWRNCKQGLHSPKLARTTSLLRILFSLEYLKGYLKSITTCMDHLIENATASSLRWLNTFISRGSRHAVGTTYSVRKTGYHPSPASIYGVNCLSNIWKIFTDGITSQRGKSPKADRSCNRYIEDGIFSKIFDFLAISSLVPLVWFSKAPQ
jgi:hypothetical protein